MLKKRSLIFLCLLIIGTFLFTGCSQSTNPNFMLTTPSTQVYSIGDTGPAGGKIFYINPDYKSDSWHYLEVAPVSTEARFEWGSNGTKIKGTKKGIGTGQKNTTKIATWLNSHSETEKAAQFCDDLVYGGYSDWYLPSLDELQRIWLNVGSPNLKKGPYWSSSEYDKTGGYYLRFSFYIYAEEEVSYKTSSLWVRAIRAF